MTQPNPNPNPNDQAEAEAKAKADAEAKAKAAKAVKLLDVVKFTHHDIITGRDIDKIGVVVRSDKDDPTVAVRPLEHHFHEVDPAELSVINAADFD